jgi:hypothetical protein
MRALEVQSAVPERIRQDIGRMLMTAVDKLESADKTLLDEAKRMNGLPERERLIRVTSSAISTLRMLCAMYYDTNCIDKANNSITEYIQSQVESLAGLVEETEDEAD